MKVGFIGLGTMGAFMAANIQKAGHQLVIHDIRREAGANRLAAGAVWADSPKAIAEQCEVIFTSLPGPGAHLRPAAAERGHHYRLHDPLDVVPAGVVGAELSAAAGIERALEEGAEDGGLDIAPVEPGGLRVAIKAGGCSGFAYTFQFEPAPKATDQVFEGPGGVKVFVDPRSLKLLDGTVLDFDEQNLMATNFTLRNPHAKSTCGCGESFSA